MYNEHIKDIIHNLKSTKDIYSICSYLMDICCEEYFKLILRILISRSIFKNKRIYK